MLAGPTRLQIPTHIPVGQDLRVFYKGRQLRHDSEEGSIPLTPQGVVNWLYGCIHHVQEVLDQLKLDWCLLWGSCIGAVRDKGFLE